MITIIVNKSIDSVKKLCIKFSVATVIPLKKSKIEYNISNMLWRNRWTNTHRWTNILVQKGVDIKKVRAQQPYKELAGSL